MNITLIIILLFGLVASAMVCMLVQNLLKASIALALVSAILSFIMFLMGAHMAAVFELSVCAGLVTVVFISAISMTRVRNQEEQAVAAHKHMKRFGYLPVVLIVVLTAVLFVLWPHLAALIPYNEPIVTNVTEQEVFWHTRLTDMIGQIIIVLAGVFGVLIFFKESGEK